MQQTYHTLSYQHASLGVKDKLTPFWRMFSSQYEAFTGEKYVTRQADLFKQALVFAEAAHAITPAHKDILEEIRNE